jgi:hypothetical protein
VPEARDGSRFNRDLMRAGSFRIGPKNEEEGHTSFESALVRLRQMPRPQWRRPNEHGNWGIVTGVRWVEPEQES